MVVIGNKSCESRDIIEVGWKVALFRRLVWQILYCEKQQSNFIANCDRLLLQSVSGITKREIYDKMRRNTCCRIQPSLWKQLLVCFLRWNWFWGFSAWILQRMFKENQVLYRQGKEYNYCKFPWEWICEKNLKEILRLLYFCL